MSTYYGPRDDLEFYVDAGNSRSYYGDPSVWNDIAEYKYPGQVLGGITYSNGSMVYENNSQNRSYYGDILEMGTDDFTIGVWTKISNLTSYSYQSLLGRGYLAGSVTGYGLLYSNTHDAFQFQDRSPAGIILGCITVSPIYVDTWYYVVGVRTYNSYLKIYLNGEYEGNSSELTPGLDTNNLTGGLNDGFKVGGNYGTGYPLKAGEIAIAHVNRKILSDTEIRRNFNYYKGRFGL